MCPYAIRFTLLRLLKCFFFFYPCAIIKIMFTVLMTVLYLLFELKKKKNETNNQVRGKKAQTHTGESNTKCLPDSGTGAG